MLLNVLSQGPFGHHVAILPLNLEMGLVGSALVMRGEGRQLIPLHGNLSGGAPALWHNQVLLSIEGVCATVEIRVMLAQAKGVVRDIQGGQVGRHQ